MVCHVEPRQPDTHRCVYCGPGRINPPRHRQHPDDDEHQADEDTHPRRGRGPSRTGLKTDPPDLD